MAKNHDFMSQVQDARREMSSWTQLQKETVQLEGRENYNRHVVQDTNQTTAKDSSRTQTNNKS